MGCRGGHALTLVSVYPYRWNGGRRRSIRLCWRAMLVAKWCRMMMWICFTFTGERRRRRLNGEGFVVGHDGTPVGSRHNLLNLVGGGSRVRDFFAGAVRRVRTRSTTMTDTIDDGRSTVFFRVEEQSSFLRHLFVTHLTGPERGGRSFFLFRVLRGDKKGGTRRAKDLSAQPTVMPSSKNRKGRITGIALFAQLVRHPVLPRIVEITGVCRVRGSIVVGLGGATLRLLRISSSSRLAVVLGDDSGIGRCFVARFWIMIIDVLAVHPLLLLLLIWVLLRVRL